MSLSFVHPQSVNPTICISSLTPYSEVRCTWTQVCNNHLVKQNKKTKKMTKKHFRCTEITSSHSHKQGPLCIHVEDIWEVPYQPQQTSNCSSLTTTILSTKVTQSRLRLCYWTQFVIHKDHVVDDLKAIDTQHHHHSRFSSSTSTLDQVKSSRALSRTLPRIGLTLVEAPHKFTFRSQWEFGMHESDSWSNMLPKYPWGVERR